LEKFLVNIRLFWWLKFVSALTLVLPMLISSGCSQSEGNVDKSGNEYSVIEWTELIPETDLEALRNQPDFLSSILDGSEEDKIDSQIQSKLEGTPESAYQAALVSSNVVAAFDSRNVRLPGFIVPLEFDENFVVTEFFLVPYFGACLHSPPPPPNQIVFVKLSDGIKLESIEQPYLVSGLLTTVSESNDLAHAAYSMTAKNIELYE